MQGTALPADTHAPQLQAHPVRPQGGRDSASMTGDMPWSTQTVPRPETLLSPATCTHQIQQEVLNAGSGTSFAESATAKGRQCMLQRVG
jgi:hypothetical protein